MFGFADAIVFRTSNKISLAVLRFVAVQHVLFASARFANGILLGAFYKWCCLEKFQVEKEGFFAPENAMSVRFPGVNQAKLKCHVFSQADSSRHTQKQFVQALREERGADRDEYLSVYPPNQLSNK